MRVRKDRSTSAHGFYCCDSSLITVLIVPMLKTRVIVAAMLFVYICHMTGIFVNPVGTNHDYPEYY